MAASLFLATKLEEAPRKLRDLLSVFHYVWCIEDARAGWKNRTELPVIDRNSREYELLLNDTITLERDILAFLGYGLHRIWGETALSPLSCLPVILTDLFPPADLSHRRLLNKAVAFINDSGRLPLVTCYPPTAIAGAAVYLAARMNDVAMPECEWWLLCGIVSEKSLYQLAGSMLDLSLHFDAYDIKVDEIYELGKEAGIVLWNEGPENYHHPGLDYISSLPIERPKPPSPPAPEPSPPPEVVERKEKEDKVINEAIEKIKTKA